MAAGGLKFERSRLVREIRTVIEEIRTEKQFERSGLRVFVPR